MPDQRMHDLWINSERARGHKSCEVHDIRFIDSESVCVLDGDEDAEKLAVILRRGRQRVGLGLVAPSCAGGAKPIC